MAFVNSLCWMSSGVNGGMCAPSCRRRVIAARAPLVRGPARQLALLTTCLNRAISTNTMMGVRSSATAPTRRGGRSLRSGRRTGSVKSYRMPYRIAIPWSPRPPVIAMMKSITMRPRRASQYSRSRYDRIVRKICNGGHRLHLVEEAALLQPAPLLCRDLDVARGEQEHLVGDLLDAAVQAEGEPGGEVDQAFGRLAFHPLKVDDHRNVGLELLADLLGVVEAGR